ncbi:MAG: prepilin-type N-terminal cleavage/methylation domain-containing protein [Planctomycetota bacterium]|nr:prepilin-type N-terminal cleavage/methylation domain-containing protein [Planctomycetota bacterium]
MTSPTGPASDASPRLRPGAAASARRRGFTLFELILVLAVLALMAAAITPSLGRFTRGRRTTDAAGQMLAVIQYAQERATQTAWPHRLVVDAQGGSYHLTARQAGSYEAVANEFGRKFDMPLSTTIEWVDSPTAMARGYVQFDPDGGHDVAQWRITDGESQGTLIGCASLSEPYRIAADGVGVAR